MSIKFHDITIAGTPVIDSTPTAGSNHAVSSGGVKSALDNVEALTAIPLSDPAAASVAKGKYVVFLNGLYQTNAAIASGETATTFASKLDAVTEGGLNHYTVPTITATSGFTLNTGNTFAVEQFGFVWAQIVIDSHAYTAKTSAKVATISSATLPKHAFRTGYCTYGSTSWGADFGNKYGYVELTTAGEIAVKLPETTTTRVAINIVYPTTI